MNKLVIDSWAWVEYFEGTELGRKVDLLLRDDETRAYCSAVSLAEIVSKFERKGMDPEEVIAGIDSLSVVVPVDEGTSIQAGKAHALMKRKQPDFGLADAFVIATAQKMGERIVTGDPHFKGLKNAMLLQE